ncbi:GH36-type glycosyl hydrolase domain-containing protein [Dongia rigui]|uniref:Glucoamylase family protein n=1 Tax=Dongia rigui TaxID=940149 RepID=A0ABU5E276_9PROT|nr:glucoamylase family protein [Dongia rigui]MDY0873698.1 glucoamylase family protein [Dongia rigui]
MIASFLTSFRTVSSYSPWDSDVPIREELFSVDRLEQHAETLAAAQTVSARAHRVPSLVRRLKANAATLLEAHQTIAKALDEGRFITPAAEWLVDNYHVVAAQVREVQTDLPNGYYRLLPKLAEGPFAGYPRVFGLAWAFVAHTDSHFDPVALQRFVHAYQRIQPLTIGEIWAIAITLRIVLVENLRRSAVRILAARAGRQEADALADRLLGSKEKAPEPVSVVLGPLDSEMLPPALAVQLIQRLRDQDPNVTPALDWLEAHLARWNTSSEAIVRDEQKRQGASNLTVRNIITSMRLVSGMNWAELVESVSRVDAILGQDSQFREMDFPTRNLYRSAIEELSRGSGMSEDEIANRALTYSTRSPRQTTKTVGTSVQRTREPGFYLIAEGRNELEAGIGFRAPLRLRLRRFLIGRGIGGYVCSTLILASLLLTLPIIVLEQYGVGLGMMALLTCLGFIPALDLATALINRDVTRGFAPVILPGMELTDGVPDHLRTMVVIPILLTSKAAIAEYVERLEIHYLTSPTGALHFALLSDWKDAATEHTDDDATLLQAAVDGIARLNARHPDPQCDRFLLLHRRRIWNDVQSQWMGWERKRGKLHELNRLLRQATDTSFMDTASASAAIPSNVRYIITLDSDTRLPRESVRRLIGKMAHPLNHPIFDDASGRVTQGYGILQPRVTPSLPMGQEGSLFQRIISGPGGIDPYAAATSDLYQDLFGEGSFTGKGIYDLDAVDAALKDRISENTVLSHDLFEGVFARAGLASDIEVVEEFPARYDVAAARLHRWVRGDWQLLPWLLEHIRRGAGNGRHALPAMGFWKMADNLRRSLTAPAILAALIAGWVMPLPAAAIWSAFLLTAMAVPSLAPWFGAIIPHRFNVTPLSHLRALGSDLRLNLFQITSHVIFLPHQAWLMTDAIVRTLYRVYFSRRNLLEWMTAAQAKVGQHLDTRGFARQMGGSWLLIAGAAIVVLLSASRAWPIAAPIIFIWALSPAVADWISRSPRDAGRLLISESDTQTLRGIARRTWRYFETFVTPEDHMLPPDNFQETPQPVLAHRTSPTNLGLYLLSAVCARDFGWAGLSETVERLSATLDTMESLEKFRGHLFNWYDTGDLRPLDPKYISTVDSGNLAGHLIALANACRAWRESPHQDPRTVFRGLSDDLRLVHAQFNPASLPGTPLEALARHIRRGESEPDNCLALLTELLPIASAARNSMAAAGANAETLYWIDSLQRSARAHLHDLTLSAEDTDVIADRLATIEEVARRMAFAMDFSFLLDVERELLSIGYLVGEGKLDPSCYDLLASEARLSSLFSIAKGDVPTSHWFRLGRTVTPIGSGAALISWSGSMFEYLMPSLVMRAPAGSLLERTNRLTVRRQIRYGQQLGLPWGISESAYNVRDLEFTYQYSPFGVPSLALKRGLGEDAVIAPYATALALMVDPAAALRNFSRLDSLGGSGRFGFYEALDFTRKRLPVGEDVAIVRAFMSHHQGMSIVAIGNALFDGAMRARFHAEPIIQASELLLQERTPRDVALERPKVEEITTLGKGLDFAPAKIRRFTSPHGQIPDTHLLSNGRYAVMLTSAGSGYSRWKDLTVTRWREDATRDDWGSYIFLRDMHTDKYWSAGYQPTGVAADRYRVAFSEDRAEIQRRDGTLTTTLEIVVSGEDDAEVRRLSITNAGGQPREIEVTSYLELVLAPQGADMAHPAFSKMFVQTEYLAHLGALIATRRQRAPSEPEIWAAQIMVVEGESIGELRIETDRMAFIGRGRDLRSPISIAKGRLTGTVGTVLDPIFAMRRRLLIDGRATVRVAYWTIVASSRQKLLDLIDRHQDASAFQRAATLSWTQAQVQLRHLSIDPEEANTFQQLASHLLYANNSMRPAEETIRRGRGPQANLWPQGISGDLPIVLLRIDDIEDISVVQQALRAHEYWRMKQISVDLVIVNERATSYTQDLQLAIDAAVRASQSRPTPGEVPGRGTVFSLRADIISVEMRGILAAVARILLVAGRGTLSVQLGRMKIAPQMAIPKKTPGPVYPADDQPGNTLDTSTLEFFNGLGGFSDGGREYTVVLPADRSTPAPWINVIANPGFGFNVSAEGSGSTWSINSREHQLTPWSNDPVSDPPGEILYIKDEENDDLWGPTALPIRRSAAPYVTRHARGHSCFEHTAHGIATHLVQFVPLQDPVKISRLTLKNLTDRTRHLSVTSYVEWVLGAARGVTAPYAVTTRDAETGAILAQNAWNAAFQSGVAFVDFAGRQTEWTGDRREFIGRNGTLQSPAAMTSGLVLSGNVGAGYDPCGVLKTEIELAPGAAHEIVLFLGEAGDEIAARALIMRYRTADLDAVLGAVSSHWDDVLGQIEVKTPDRAMDIMLNGWMLYQTLACRIWARSGFYQASGAFGFRDQLQDGMALAVTRPDLTRAHLLRAAGRQFREGDLQHWWLPPHGQGVRTRISDDRVWLAYAVGHYVETTGDRGVLEEVLPFLDGPALGPGEHDSFFQPMTSDDKASLYEHCALGLDRSLEVGAHGLPLIGTGDWNDGLNRVGQEGRGESVWLGWFLYTTLLAFADLAVTVNDLARAGTWRSHATALQAALEAEGWDGNWYRRGYFDDGSALGSASSAECQIDSIAQSWAVLSGAAAPERAARAMMSLDQRLIRRDDKLALLFTPPFDQSMPDPGYIKGYPPGLRENGGQYTHAATWTVLALAKLGDGDKAADLFNLLNPINHAKDEAACARYKVEPYAVPADVYSVAPHSGRGGWTWYTGSAGWLYRAGIEGILGIKQRNTQLLIAPCMPKGWPGFEAIFRYKSTTYNIVVSRHIEKGDPAITASLDGRDLPSGPVRVPLIDDGATHEVLLRVS